MSPTTPRETPIEKLTRDSLVNVGLLWSFGFSVGYAPLCRMSSNVRMVLVDIVSEELWFVLWSLVEVITEGLPLVLKSPLELIPLLAGASLPLSVFPGITIGPVSVPSHEIKLFISNNSAGGPVELMALSSSFCQCTLAPILEPVTVQLTWAVYSRKLFFIHFNHLVLLCHGSDVLARALRKRRQPSRVVAVAATALRVAGCGGD